MEVAEPPVGADDLAEEECAAVAETRDVPAELMPGVGLRHRTGTGRDEGADQQAQTVGAAQPVRVEAELLGQRCVEHQQPGVGGLLGLPGERHLPELAGEAVVEDDDGCGGDAHALEATWAPRPGQRLPENRCAPYAETHREVDGEERIRVTAAMVSSAAGG